MIDGCAGASSEVSESMIQHRIKAIEGTLGLSFIILLTFMLLCNLQGQCMIMSTT